MNNESNTTAEIQELLAISGEYLSMGTEQVVPHRGNHLGDRVDADPAQQSGEAA